MIKRVVRRTTKRVYKHAIKPVLFKQHPDDVHKRLIKVAKRTQRIPVVKRLPKLWAYQAPCLEQTILGLHFKNPVGLAAGFDKDIEMAPTIKNVGFGWMTGGSVTAQPCKGNVKPWFYRLPRSKSLVVHAGLPSDGIVTILHRLATYPVSLFTSIPLAVSVAKTNSKETALDEQGIADYCESLRLLNIQNHCQLYEINISCPNAFGGEPFTDPERLEKLLAAIDSLKLHSPVFLKMPIDKPWPEFRELLQVASEHNIQGVTIGNLLKDRSAAHLSEPLPDEIKGSLSGKPTSQISTELIRQTYCEFSDRFVIIGVGGIFSAHDAYKKIRAGASLVALITGMIFEGPQLIGEINAGLESYLKRDGFGNIHEAVGVDTHDKKGV